MRLSVVLAISALIAFAAEKGPPKGEGSNRLVRIQATAFLDKASIDKAVGAKMEPGVVVVAVKLIPAEGQKLTVALDDFLIRSDYDGQKGTPYTPSQVAGNSVLMVTEKWSGGGVGTQETGPAWGGLGGGRPSRLPGGGSGVGNSGGTAEAASAVRDNENPVAAKENPLLAALKAKILAEAEVSGEASGQLYFLLEGKPKPKHIELIYKTAAGPVSIRFKE